MKTTRIFVVGSVLFVTLGLVWCIVWLCSDSDGSLCADRQVVTRATGASPHSENTNPSVYGGRSSSRDNGNSDASLASDSAGNPADSADDQVDHEPTDEPSEEDIVRQILDSMPPIPEDLIDDPAAFESDILPISLDDLAGVDDYVE